jgi:hypothetical protein
VTPLNFPRVAMAAVAAWAISLPMGFLVNQIVLKGIYTANARALRPEAEIIANVPFGYAFMLVGFFVFAYTYAKGYEGGSGPLEGLRFGVIVALLIDCFAIGWEWVTVPINGTMARALMIGYIVEYALYGTVVGAVYRPVPRTPGRAATL